MKAWFILVHNRKQYHGLFRCTIDISIASWFILVHIRHRYHGLFWCTINISIMVYFWCTIDISIMVYFYAKWTLASRHFGLSYSCVIQRTPIFWICADVNRIGPPPSCPGYVVTWLERFFDIPTRWLCFFSFGSNVLLWDVQSNTKRNQVCTCLSRAGDPTYNTIFQIRYAAYKTTGHFYYCNCCNRI